MKEGLTMETTYYTLNAREIVVSSDGMAQVSGGEGRRLVFTRQTPVSAIPRKPDNVISLADYRSSQAEPSGGEDPDFPPDGPECSTPGLSRARTNHRQEKVSYLELVTSAALIGVAAAACAAFLL